MSCGAMKWFDSVAPDGTQTGLTRSQHWSGTGLGATWASSTSRLSLARSF
jgi:hypothetical protein